MGAGSISKWMAGLKILYEFKIILKKNLVVNLSEMLIFKL